MDEDLALFGVGRGQRDLSRATQVAAVFYTHYYIAVRMSPTVPLEVDLLGQHSARQEERTVVLPWYRKVALG